LRIFHTGQFLRDGGEGGALASVFPVRIVRLVKMSCPVWRDGIGVWKRGVEAPKRSLRRAFTDHKKAKEEEEIEE